MLPAIMFENVTSFTHRHDREQYRVIGKTNNGLEC